MKLNPYAEILADRLYTTYCAAVGGMAFNGDPLPTWHNFRDDPTKLKQSDAWVMCAQEAIEALAEE